MRRAIFFSNWSELESDLLKLEEAILVETTGIWSFCQILQHIDNALYCSMHGYPTLLPKIIRKTIGKLAIKYFLRRGFMNPGLPNPTTAKVRIEGDAKTSMKMLKLRLKEYREFKGLHAIHTIFDVLNKDEWEKLHLMHFSLHLSYCHPSIAMDLKSS